MKKELLLTGAVFLIMTGCMMAPPSGTIYFLDYSAPPVPYIAPPPSRPGGIAVVQASALPSLVVVETVPDIYYVQTTPNMFFYSNLWYYYYGGCWYRSHTHTGPWISLEISLLPSHFRRVPEHHFRQSGPSNYRPRYEDDHGRRDRDDHGRGDRDDRGGSHRGGDKK